MYFYICNYEFFFLKKAPQNFSPHLDTPLSQETLKYSHFAIFASSLNLSISTSLFW